VSKLTVEHYVLEYWAAWTAQDLPTFRRWSHRNVCNSFDTV